MVSFELSTEQREPDHIESREEQVIIVVCANVYVSNPQNIIGRRTRKILKGSPF